MNLVGWESGRNREKTMFIGMEIINLEKKALFLGG